MEEKMVVYYSFVFYCMVMFSFIACIILLCKAFGGVVFEVQTYINSKREVEVSPRGTRIFSKWFAGILGIFFIFWLGTICRLFFTHPEFYQEYLLEYKGRYCQTIRKKLHLSG